MNSIEFVKHPLKDNDTLESVAEELSISSEYLQLIHNLNVEVCDKLKSSKGNFPSHLAEIYIEKTTQNAFLEKLNEKRPKNKEILEYIPQKDKKCYTVFYDFSDGEEQNTISFETSIVAVENNSNIKGYLVEIDRTSSIVVDNELPQLVIDEFTIETAKVIYPLQLIISPGGKCIGIKNYEEIIKRWEIVKQKVHDIFESQWVEHYLSYTDITLQSKETLFASLKKDWFLSTFFATIYTNYYSNYKINNTLKFPTLPDFEDFEYSIVQKMNNYSDDTNQLTISQEGTIENQKHESDAPLTPINGHFKAEYLLDPKDNSIKKITVNCSLDFTKPKKLAIAINQKQ